MGGFAEVLFTGVGPGNGGISPLPPEWWATAPLLDSPALSQIRQEEMPPGAAHATRSRRTLGSVLRTQKIQECLRLQRHS